MNILVILGSPRKNGNSETLVKTVIEGIEEKILCTVESIYLHGLKDLHPCRGCGGCEKTGMCVIKDDMQKVYPLLEKADAIVISGPVYWFTISAQAKLCIDRWYALFDEDNPAEGKFKDKQIGIVLTYGDTDLYTSGGINAIHTFESMFRYIGAEIEGMVYGTANDIGDAEKQPELMESAYKLGQKLGGMAISA